MVFGNKSILSKPTPSRTTQARSNQPKATPSKTTPIKSTPIKSTPVKPTPVKPTPVKPTPVKSTPIKSTPVKSTPQKRRLESSGGSTKKIKLDIGIKAKGIEENEVPSIVLSMGGGVTGQLGLGVDITDRKRPTEIPNLKDIVAIRAGGMHSVCLTKNGKLYTFGCEEEGALGRQIIEDEEATVPAEVTLPENIIIKDITAGDNHSSVLTQDGQVYIWGNFRDESGMIGLLKPFQKLLYPTLVPVGNHKIVKVCSGYNHLAMLTEAGDVLTFGCSEFGQLGRVSSNNLERGGRVGLAPLLSLGSVRIQKNTKFVDVWAGSYCTVARGLDGNIYGCGLNNYGQLGVKGDMILMMMTNLVGFSSIDKSWANFVFGDHHMMGLTESGRLFAVGRGECGSLGQGDYEHRDDVIEVKLPSNGIAAIAACNRTSYALMKDGSAFSWGMGCNNQLGHGTDDDDINVPTRIGGKQLDNKRLVEISPGYQHVLFRAIPGVVDQIIEVAPAQVMVNEVIETIKEVEEPINEEVTIPETVNEQHKENVEQSESIQDFMEPVGLSEESIVKTDEPIVEREEPIIEKEEPIIEKEEPITERLEPIVETEEPIVECQESVGEQQVHEELMAQVDMEITDLQENTQPILEVNDSSVVDEELISSGQNESMEVDASAEIVMTNEDEKVDEEVESMEVESSTKPETSSDSNNNKNSGDGNIVEQVNGDN